MKQSTKDIEVLAETAEYIAVYKPAGLAVQSRSITEPDLEHALKNGGRTYLAVINRLDQTVEGIVLFGKTRSAAAELSDQLQKHRIKKEYLAVVEGIPESSSGELRNFLLKNGRTNTSSVVAEGTKDAKEAILKYECLKTKGDTSLLKIRLYTGRHHQIRVQLSAAGHPIAGDRKYGQGNTIQRFPALCSSGLEFKDPESKRTVIIKTSPKGEMFEKYTEFINR